MFSIMYLSVTCLLLILPHLTTIRAEVSTTPKSVTMVSLARTYAPVQRRTEECSTGHFSDSTPPTEVGRASEEEHHEVATGEMIFTDVTTTATDLSDTEIDWMTLVKVWAWYKLPWNWLVILQLVCAVVGIVGNLLVIVVLYQRRNQSRSTDTLIGALAVADFLTSLFLVPVPAAITMPNNWVGQIYCRLVAQPLYMWYWVTVSTYILTTISVERYIAVAHPIYFNRILTRQRTLWVVFCVCVISALVTSVSILVRTVHPVSRYCIIQYSSRTTEKLYGIYTVFIRLLLPTTIMVVTQTLIAILLHKQSRRFTAPKPSSENIHLRAKTKVIRMMLVVIILFVVCWAPVLLYYLLVSLEVLSLSYHPYQVMLVLGFFNSCANPFIYSLQYREFRLAVMGVFTGASARNTALFDTNANSKEDSITMHSTVV